MNVLHNVALTPMNGQLHSVNYECCVKHTSIRKESALISADQWRLEILQQEQILKQISRHQVTLVH
jgi:hypothetical protein